MGGAPTQAGVQGGFSQRRSGERTTGMPEPTWVQGRPPPPCPPGTQVCSLKPSGAKGGGIKGGNSPTALQQKSGERNCGPSLPRRSTQL